MQTILEQLQALSEQELNDLQMKFIPEERKRREQQKLHDQAQAEVVQQLWEAGEVEPPAAVEDITDTTTIADIPAWSNPGTTHTRMYRFGAIVQHNGRIWKSTTPNLNSWEPGAEGVHSNVWLDVTGQVPTQEAPEDSSGQDAPEVPVFVAGMQVTVGDTVAYNGAVYEVLQAHTTAAHWPPDAAHSLFRKVA